MTVTLQEATLNTFVFHLFYFFFTPARNTLVPKVPEKMEIMTKKINLKY
jgi:hypothetical protein